MKPEHGSSMLTLAWKKTPKVQQETHISNSFSLLLYRNSDGTFERNKMRMENCAKIILQMEKRLTLALFQCFGV